MAKPPPTRQALLERKERIALASQGRELLDQKRSALMHEILEIADQVMSEADRLRTTAARARRALARAKGRAGPEAVRSAGLAARGDIPLKVSTRTVMGVRVPALERRRISRSAMDRGYSFVGTPVTLDETAQAFEAEAEAIIDLAESELRLRRLAEEVRSTSRRLNALEHILIPRLERERDEIERVLEDRERADRFRLKRAKKKLAR